MGVRRVVSTCTNMNRKRADIRYNKNLDFTKIPYLVSLCKDNPSKIVYRKAFFLRIVQSSEPSMAARLKDSR